MYVADHRHGCFLREAKADLDRPIDGMLCMKLHVSISMARQVSNTNHSPQSPLPHFSHSTSSRPLPSAHPPSSPPPLRLEHATACPSSCDAFSFVAYFSRACRAEREGEVDCGRQASERSGPREPVVQVVTGDDRRRRRASRWARGSLTRRRLATLPR